MACGYCRGERNDLTDNRAGDYLDGVTVVLTREDGPWEIVATGYYDGGYKCGTNTELRGRTGAPGTGSW